MSMEVHQSHVLKGGAKNGRTEIGIPEIPSQPRITGQTWSSQTTRTWNQQISWFQKLRKQVNLLRSCLFRSCTLCVQGLAQRQDSAQPHAVTLCLPLSVHDTREGPAPGALVSSQLDQPWPSLRASDPLGGIDALSRPSCSCGDVAFDANLVKPRAKRPRDRAERPNSGAGAFHCLRVPHHPAAPLGLAGC